MRYVVLMIAVLFMLLLCSRACAQKIERIDSSTYMIVIDNSNFNVVTTNETLAVFIIEKYSHICTGWKKVPKFKSGKKYSEVTIYFTEKPVKKYRYALKT